MVVCTGNSRTREMLAYCRLIIREALRHGGNGWQEYDCTFRRQADIDTNIPWNTLQPGLQVATLLGFPSNRGTFCSLCREPDHHSNQCAFTVMQQPVRTAPSADFHKGPELPNRHPFRPPRRPKTILSICASWNHGTCAFPGSCTVVHIQAYLWGMQQNHKGIKCPNAPVGSDYHRLQTTGRRPAGTGLSTARL